MNIKTILIGLVLIGVFSFVNAESTWSDGTGISFDTGSGALCTFSGSLSTWNENGLQLNSMGDCYRTNGIDSNGNTIHGCCPEGQYCDGTTANSLCKQSTVSASKCSDYKTQNQCNGVVLNENIKTNIEEIANIKKDGSLVKFCHSYYDGSSRGECVYLGNCYCEWDSTNRVCVSNYVRGNPCDIDNPNKKQCKILTNEVIDKCNQPEEIMSLGWTATIIELFGSGRSYAGNEDWCKGGSREFPCPERTDLPFFSLINMLMVIISIMIIYFIKKK
ncbi:MAG: hypothetical protein WC781_05090 [Candidatus Pacearchaeota archaeon]